MARDCARNGLLLAGVIVTLIGVGIVAIHTLGIPRHWMVLVVGVSLLAAGVVRAALGRRPRAGGTP